MALDITAVTGVGATQPTSYLKPSESVATDGSAFAQKLGVAINEIQALHGTSNELAIKAATGELTDIHEATLAATRASVALEMATTFRNRGVEAFNEIMRMQA